MAQTNLIGKIILGYQVEEKLGSGAFGTVYKVIKSNPSGQYVRALKHITIPTEKQYFSVLNSMGGDVSKADNYFSEMLNNIVSEIRILNALSEKGIQHIVRYYENDIVVTDSPRRYDVFILMEYLTPLEDSIQGKIFFTVSDVMKLGLDILDGIRSCHQNGVIHRDIKDDNIFVSDKGGYKIGDFGVSKVLKDSSKAESLKGTPNFLAPEVYLGKESYTKSVDLYSLGIVLYRLLNYNRNPFLPPFPEQYFTQDEDIAFEKRMSGERPSLPSLGGECIGEVIIKAISSSTERYQNADDFINALENAIRNTPKEFLEQNIKFNTVAHATTISDSREKQYGATLGENAQQSVISELQDESQESSINKYLFESIGDNQNSQIPQVEQCGKNENDDSIHEKNNTIRSAIQTNRVVSFIPPQIKEPTETTTAFDNKIINKFIFGVPIVVLLIGIVSYFVILPKLYGNAVSFIDWLFTNPDNIIETMRSANAVLPKVHSIIGIRIFCYVWLASFITSLFFVGKQFHTKPKPNVTNAILTRKEPYLMIQDVSEALKQIKQRQNNQDLNTLIYAVKCLEEKLAIESDFGYGNNAVINCENNIARQLQFLIDTVQDIEAGNFIENIKIMNETVNNVSSLLRRRMELKKR